MWSPQSYLLMSLAFPLICYSGCAQKDAMYHIWRECLKVDEFWTHIYNLINSLMQIIKISKSPLKALLNQLIKGVPSST